MHRRIDSNRIELDLPWIAAQY